MTDINNQPGCYCGSDKQFAECCEPFINGERFPVTAEQLMRSRYCAFVVSNGDYLRKSWVKDTCPDDVLMEEDDLVWTSLEIQSTEKGQAEDDTGIVTFLARYKQKGQVGAVHEESDFIRDEDGHWLYHDGRVPGPKEPVKSNKVGRNEPCPCGSGKKYKRCCGR